MQIFYFPEWITVLIFIGLWFVFQGGAALYCFKKPDSYFAKDSWLYKTRNWEKQGTIYNKIFYIRKWKGLLPDGGALFGGYAKKHIKNTSENNLEKFVLESRRAELTHWLAILPFWVFGFFADIWIIPIMLVYAILVNMPCIMAQRYNRPRIHQLLKKMNSQAK